MSRDVFIYRNFSLILNFRGVVDDIMGSLTAFSDLRQVDEGKLLLELIIEAEEECKKNEDLKRVESLSRKSLNFQLTFTKKSSTNIKRKISEKKRMSQKEIEVYKNTGTNNEEVRAELKKINSKMSLFADN